MPSCLRDCWRYAQAVARHWLVWLVGGAAAFLDLAALFLPGFLGRVAETVGPYKWHGLAGSFVIASARAWIEEYRKRTDAFRPPTLRGGVKLGEITPIEEEGIQGLLIELTIPRNKRKRRGGLLLEADKALSSKACEAAFEDATGSFVPLHQHGKLKVFENQILLRFPPWYLGDGILIRLESNEKLRLVSIAAESKARVTKAFSLVRPRRSA